MTYSLTWMPDVLSKAGLKVVLEPGWQTRGHGDFGPPEGVLLHHTAGPPRGEMPDLSIIINGRPGLSGPLANLSLGRSGTYYVIAAGRAYHAGFGTWNNVTSGNSCFIGIEAENTGVAGDPWPLVQMDAYQRGVAALLAHMGRDASWCAGHKEYAIPAGRKTDPDFDMDMFRKAVAKLLEVRE